jgi:hypothetical protein
MSSRTKDSEKTIYIVVWRHDDVKGELTGIETWHNGSTIYSTKEAAAKAIVKQYAELCYDEITLRKVLNSKEIRIEGSNNIDTVFTIEERKLDPIELEEPFADPR